MSLFKRNSNVEESVELTGYAPLPTDLYIGVVKKAYLTMIPSKDNAQNLNINMNWVIDLDNNGRVEERSFSTFIGKLINGEAVYFYDKEGKKVEYASFGALRRQLENLINKSLFDDGVLVMRTLPVFNPQTKKEEPREVYVIESLLGVKGAFGIVENHENGYQDSSKVVKKNTLERAWVLQDNQPFTREEITAGLNTPANAQAWVDRNRGKVNDRNLDNSKITGGNSAKGSASVQIG